MRHMSALNRPSKLSHEIQVLYGKKEPHRVSIWRLQGMDQPHMLTALFPEAQLHKSLDVSVLFGPDFDNRLKETFLCSGDWFHAKPKMV